MIDYTKLDESGLKPVVSAFDKAGVSVLKTEGDNKQKRIKGQPTKQATIFFTDGQQVTMLATPDNVIYQWLLNGKIIPVVQMPSGKNADQQMQAAIKEVAGKVLQNSPTFAKKLARDATKAHRNDAGDGKKGAVSNAIPAKLKAVNMQIAEAQTKLAEVQQSAQERQKAAQERGANVADMERRFNDLKAKNGALQAEYDTLRKAA